MTNKAHTHYLTKQAKYPAAMTKQLFKHYLHSLRSKYNTSHAFPKELCLPEVHFTFTVKSIDRRNNFYDTLFQCVSKLEIYLHTTSSLTKPQFTYLQNRSAQCLAYMFTEKYEGDLRTL